MKVRLKWSVCILIALVLAYALTMSYFSIQRHRAFASSYDLANMDQTVWNTSRGNFFQLSGETGLVSRFSFHANLILILIAPLYWIFPKVESLLALQSFLIGLGAVPIFLLGRSVLKNDYKSLLISATYLLNSGVMWSNIYDFHPITVGTTFLLFAFYFVYHKRNFPTFIFLFLALLTNENVGMFVFVLGLYVFVVQKRRIGIAISTIGLTWLITMIFGVMPLYSSGGRHWAWSWFRFDKLSQLFDRVFSVESTDYLILLFKQFGFVPLLGFPWLIFIVPDLFMNLLSSQGQMRSIFFHYDSLIVAGLCIAAIFGWHYFSLLTKKIGVLSWLLGILMLTFALRTNYHYSPLPYTPSHWKQMYNVGVDEIEFESKLRSIPKDASITASSEVRAHLTHRQNAYNLPNMVYKTDYIAIVDQNRLVGDYEPKTFETKLIKELMSRNDYQIDYHRGHFYLFKKTSL